jgi:hypothetical protein
VFGEGYFSPPAEDSADAKKKSFPGSSIEFIGLMLALESDEKGKGLENIGFLGSI